MQDYTFDLQRIFFGDLPLMFLVEIGLRTLIMLVYLLLLLRLIGRRSLTQLSLFEAVLIIGLGSAVGDPMFYADVPVIHGLAVITFVVLIERFLIWFTNHNHQVEDALEGTPLSLIVDGQFDLQGVKESTMSRNEIYMELRLAGVEQMGQVKRSYVELNGEMSIFLHDEPKIRPGLPVMPGMELGRATPVPMTEPVNKSSVFACLYCGNTVTMEAGQTLSSCSRCHEEKWIEADSTGVKVE